jgi:hypothetical protein
MGRIGNNPKILTNDDGTLVGVNIGADYCAEHEWGIKRIILEFRPNQKKSKKLLGAEFLRNKQFPQDSISFMEVDGYYCIYFDRFSHKFYANKITDYIKQYLNGELSYMKDKNDVCGAWCEKDFLIVLKNEEHFNTLREAFETNDLMISTMGGGVFQNGGLSFLIVSRIPEEVKQSWIDADLSNMSLENDVEKSNIRKILKKAGKRYYALSPRRISKKEMNDHNTKYDFIFWLNPQEQSIHNNGWYSVEVLKQWAKNEGPIMMSK